MGRQPEDCESTRPFSRRYGQGKVERFCSSGKVSIKPPESRIVAADVRRRDSIFYGDPPLHSGGYGGYGGLRLRSGPYCRCCAKAQAGCGVATDASLGLTKNNDKLWRERLW